MSRAHECIPAAKGRASETTTGASPLRREPWAAPLPSDEALHNIKEGFGADPRRSFSDVKQGAHPLNNADTGQAACSIG